MNCEIFYPYSIPIKVVQIRHYINELSHWNT